RRADVLRGVDEGAAETAVADGVGPPERARALARADPDDLVRVEAAVTVGGDEAHDVVALDEGEDGPAAPGPRSADLDLVPDLLAAPAVLLDVVEGRLLREVVDLLATVRRVEPRELVRLLGGTEPGRSGAGDRHAEVPVGVALDVRPQVPDGVGGVEAGPRVAAPVADPVRGGREARGLDRPGGAGEARRDEGAAPPDGAVGLRVEERSPLFEEEAPIGAAERADVRRHAPAERAGPRQGPGEV